MFSHGGDTNSSQQLNRYFTYNVSTKQFQATDLALELERNGADTFGPRSFDASVAGKGDVEMADDFVVLNNDTPIKTEETVA